MPAQSNTAAQLDRAPIWSRIILRSGLASHLRLHAGDVAVLLCLADHANKEGIAWPKQTTIMHETGLSKRGVRNASKRIVALGIIQRRKRFKLYEYMLPDEADVDRLIAQSTPAETGIEAQNAPEQTSEAQSAPDSEAQNAPDRGTECPRPEAQSTSQKVKNRSYKPEDEKPEAGGLSLTERRRAQEEADILQRIKAEDNDILRRLLVGDVMRQPLWRPAFKAQVLAFDAQSQLIAQRRQRSRGTVPAAHTRPSTPHEISILAAD